MNLSDLKDYQLQFHPSYLYHRNLNHSQNIEGEYHCLSGSVHVFLQMILRLLLLFLNKSGVLYPRDFKWKLQTG